MEVITWSGVPNTALRQDIDRSKDWTILATYGLRGIPRGRSKEHFQIFLVVGEPTKWGRVRIRPRAITWSYTRVIYHFPTLLNHGISGDSKDVGLYKWHPYKQIPRTHHKSWENLKWSRNSHSILGNYFQIGRKLIGRRINGPRHKESHVAP